MIAAHPQTDITEKPPEQEAADRIQLASRLSEHLAEAAKLASEFGVPPDAFAAAAWHAYLQRLTCLGRAYRTTPAHGRHRGAAQHRPAGQGRSWARAEPAGSAGGGPSRERVSPP